MMSGSSNETSEANILHDDSVSLFAADRMILGAVLCSVFYLIFQINGIW